MRLPRLSSGLVERLQVEARESPQRYKLKLALLAALGFAVRGAILGLAFGLPIALAAYLLGTMRTCSRALRRTGGAARFGARCCVRYGRIEVPPVIACDRRCAALHAEIERLRLAIGAPALAGVVIDAN